MTTGRSKALRGLLATGAAAGCVAALGSGSPASADAGAAPETAPPSATISARGSMTARPQYTGSTSIASGAVLRVRLLGNPKAIGGHTFTLVSATVVPTTPKAQKNCFTPGKICLIGAMAHKFNPQTEKVGLQLVEAGQPGWDTRFTKTVKKGDSWYSEKKGEAFSQVVSAKAGAVLKFMCLVHPEMQRNLKVTQAAG